MAAIKTFELALNEKLDFKFDLAGRTNGSGSTSDVLQPGETISVYTLQGDAGIILSNDVKLDGDTSLCFFASFSGDARADESHYVDAHFITNSSPAREYSFSMRFIAVQRK